MMNIKKYALSGLLGLFAVTLSPLSDAAKIDSLLEAQEIGKVFSPNTTTNMDSLFKSIRAEKLDYIKVLALINAQKLIKAEQALTKLRKEQPDNINYINLQGLLATLNKQNKQAIAIYKKVLKRDKKNYLAQVSLARLYLKQGQLDQAKKYANNALKLNSLSVDAYLVVAEVVYKKLNPAKSYAVLAAAVQKIKKTDDLNAEIRLLRPLAKLAKNAGKSNEILKLAKDLVARYPNNNIALSGLASAYLDVQKISPAVEILQRIIVNDNKDVGHRMLLATLWLKAKDKEVQILQLLDEVLALNHKHQQAVVMKSTVLLKNKRFSDALALAKSVQIRFPKLMLGYMLAGDVYWAQNNLEQAYMYYAKAYKFSALTRLLNRMADIRIRQGKSETALNLLAEESKRTDRPVVGVYLKWANILLSMNKKHQAQALYEKVIAKEENTIQALNNLAWLYRKENLDKGLSLAKRAYDLAHNNESVVDTYAYLLFEKGALKQAQKIFEELILSHKKISDDTVLHYAEVLFASGRVITAKKMLQNLQDKTKSTAIISKIERLLNKY